MLGRILTIAIMVTGMMAAPAWAQERDDYASPGVYLGAGVDVGFENFEGTGPIEFETPVGVDAWLGFRFLPMLAAEAEIEYLNGFDPEIGVIEMDALTFTVNGKVFLATGPVQPFALVGVGVSRFNASAFGIDDSESDFAARFGGGLDFYLTESFGVGAKASYVLTTGDLDGLDYVSLVFGGQFRF